MAQTQKEKNDKLRAKNKALGRHRKEYPVTDKEHEEILKLLNKLRK